MHRRNLLWELGVLLMVQFAFVAESQMIVENDVQTSADGFRGLEESAFHALRSCHQVFRSHTGEFFSPDYLCSSPALWCNWTIQVQRGKRVQLYLEDLTPEQLCHLKTDQIHLEETPVASSESRILEKCWRKARYTSVSNTVHVVQLIGANPSPPHRGFYGWYQSFGPVAPPVPASSVDGNHIRQEVSLEEEDEEEIVPPESSVTREPVLPMDNTEYALGDTEEVIHAGNSWTNQLPTPTVPWERNHGEVRKTRGGAVDQLYANGTAFVERVSELPVGGAGTTAQLSAGGTQSTHVNTATSTTKTLTQPTEGTPGSTFSSHSSHTETSLADSDGTFVTEKHEYGLAQNGSSRKLKTSHRTKGKSLPVQSGKSLAEPVHFPGSILLEVTVEVGLDHNNKGSSNQINTFGVAVENMVERDLQNFKLKDVSSKRAKRLSKGVLLILWVQLKEGVEEGRSHSVLRSTLQGLNGRSISTHDQSHGKITSVSVEDVNECETQMVMCDVHAECVNEFGSYSCHCRHGYSSGLGGAVCAQPEGGVCSRDAFPTVLSVVCCLLCLLVTLLLLVLGVVYRRYHRGQFLPRCQHNSVAASVHEFNNNHPRNGTGDEDSSCHLPPPPPPVRLPKDAAEPPLLKFSPLLPSNGFGHKTQREKE